MLVKGKHLSLLGVSGTECCYLSQTSSNLVAIVGGLSMMGMTVGPRWPGCWIGDWPGTEENGLLAQQSSGPCSHHLQCHSCSCMQKGFLAQFGQEETLVA